jgi:ferredoxin
VIRRRTQAYPPDDSGQLGLDLASPNETGVALRVDVDFGLCEANGVCMGIVPEVFDLGDDDQLAVQESLVGPAHEAGVRDAARQCPRQAITLTE